MKKQLYINILDTKLGDISFVSDTSEWIFDNESFIKKSISINKKTYVVLVHILNRGFIGDIEEGINEFVLNLLNDDSIINDLDKKALADSYKNIMFNSFKKETTDSLREPFIKTFRNAKVIPIIAAPFISPNAKTALKVMNFGYVDSSPGLYINQSDFYINFESINKEKSRKKRLKSLYSLKSNQIIMTLIDSGYKKWDTTELAVKSRVSNALVSKVKEILISKKWITDKRRQFELIEPYKLLDEFSEAMVKPPIIENQFVSIQSINLVENDIVEICNRMNMNYAFSGFSAAIRIAPMVRRNRVNLLVEKEEVIKIISARLDLKHVISGGTCIIQVPAEKGLILLSEEHGGEKTISASATYRELANNPARGNEAAEEILEKEIKPRWEK